MLCVVYVNCVLRLKNLLFKVYKLWGFLGRELIDEEIVLGCVS